MKKNKIILKEKELIQPFIGITRQSLVKFYIVSFALLFSCSMLAQDNKITISMEDVSLGEILLEIKMQSGKSILFNNDIVDEYKYETLKVKNVSLEKALHKCLQGKNMQYRIVEGVIIIEPINSDKRSDESARLVQTIRGSIIDKESKISLPGANIIVLSTDPFIGSISDTNGNFRLKNVPVGRHTLRVSFVGYEELIIPEILIGSAREVVLTLELVETSEEIAEVIVRPYDKGSPKNDMAIVSARSFSVEESQRYAGSIGDPGRMALSFAGVNTDDDASNQVVVRGNSPNSMLWRLEGVQIPIPNHFSVEGWDAGYVSLLNTKMLGSSDFFTGAFPAEYGNSTSGVFDLSFRNGNNEKRENTFEFGMLGADISTEGPFSKNYKGSYLINFRYATFAIMNLMGITVGGDVLPEYTDLSFKFYLPTKKVGTFSIWGMGGTGNYKEDAVRDTTLWEEYSYLKYGYITLTKMGATGITHTISPDNKSYLKTILSYSGNSSLDKTIRLEKDYTENTISDELLSSSAFRFSTSYNRKFTSKLSMRTGFIFSKLYYNYDSKYIIEEEDTETWFEDVMGNGNTETYQGFFQAKYQIVPKLTINAGLHYLQFALNGENSFEPRAGFQWKLPNSQTINGGFGMHSRHDYLMYYFTQIEDEDGNAYYPNKNLGLQKSTHYVLGYTKMFTQDLKFQVEVYYQDLSKLPVSSDSSKTWSPINDDIFGYDYVSQGTGRNFGIEFTLEKYFTNNYYFLVTNSIYSAKYKPLDGHWYNVRYNNNYITNILGGKEWRIHGKNILGVNGRFIWSGGRRDTPVDESKLGSDDWDIYDHKRRYESQFADYLRFDLGISYRINNPKVAHEFKVDIQNLTNRENIGGAYYDIDMEETITYTLQGILPVISYKIHF